MPEPQTPAPAGLDAEQARRALRRGLVYAGGGLLVLGGIVGAVAATPLGREALEDLLARMRPGYLALAWLLMTSAFGFMALRWRALMPVGFRPSLGGLSAMLCAGLLLNYAVPGPVGELGAAWFAHRRYGLPLAGSLASGVTARALGLASAAVLTALAWLFFDLPVPEGYDRLVAAVALLVGSMGLVLASVAWKPLWWRGLTEAILGRMRGPGPLGRLAGRLASGVGALTDSFAEVLHRGGRAWAWATLWALAGHGAVILSIAVAVEGLGSAADPAGLVFTYATTTAGAVALFALPGSQVGWDALFVALLVGTTGLQTADALAIAALVRAQQLSVMALGAIAVAWLLPSAARSAPLG